MLNDFPFFGCLVKQQKIFLSAEQINLVYKREIIIFVLCTLNFPQLMAVHLRQI